MDNIKKSFKGFFKGKGKDDGSPVGGDAKDPSETASAGSAEPTPAKVAVVEYKYGLQDPVFDPPDATIEYEPGIP